MHFHKKTKWSKAMWQEMIMPDGLRWGYEFQSRTCTVCNKEWRRRVD